MRGVSRQWSVLSIPLCAIFFALCAPIHAEQSTKVARVGFLSAASAVSVAARVEAFRQALRQIGYIEGKTVTIDYRYADDNIDRIRALAADLVRRNLDVIVTGGPTATRLVKETTSVIPIVMAQDTDPVKAGFIKSLARPGSNETGLATLSPEISGKQLELLKEILPKFSRLSVLGSSTTPGNAQALNETERAAVGFRLEIQYHDVLSPKDIGPAFQAVANYRAGAILALPSPLFTTHRKQLIDLGIKSRLPAVYARSEIVEEGGLMTYGVSFTDLFRRAAIYVDKILRGAKPADLPVEQPTKFELLINLKTAKQIGLTIPPNVLARADRVIR